jgi:hypothetical protein
MRRRTLRGRDCLLFTMLVLLAVTGVASGQGLPQFFAETGHWYQVINRPLSLSWTQCRDSAAALGGYLATISSSAENSFVLQISAPPEGKFLGGIRTAVGPPQVWEWVTGESWSYTSWNGGEPSDNSDENYLELFNTGPAIGLWNNIADNSGEAGSFVVEYNADPQPCVFGNTLRFDGVDDYVFVAHNPSQNPASLTLEAYMKMDSIPTSVPSSCQAIISKWRGASSSVGSYMLQIASMADSGKVLLNIEPSLSLFSRQRLNPHQWYHVAATWDGSTAAIYIDGVLDTATSMIGGLYSSREITIGRNSHSLWDGGVATYSFNGVIDEVRISSIARTPSEFCLTSACTSDANTVALWHLDETCGTLALDASGHGVHGTIYGAQHVGCSSYTDTDGDCIADSLDNCPAFVNAGQEDADGDGIGNLCDNCPYVFNPEQEFVCRPDTVIVGQPDCFASVNHNNLSIPVYLNNHDTLKAVDVPLCYDWPFDPDSISYVGTRVQDFDVKIRSIDAVNKKIRIALIADDGGSGLVLPPVDAATANMPIAKIIFHLPYQCSQEMIAAPDSCTLVLPGDNLQSLKVVDNHDVGYVPGLERDSTKVLRYKPGDCNGDDNVDISDVVCLISYIFSGGTPACLAASDANGDGSIDISDPVYLIAYIFSGGSMPGTSLLCDYVGPFAKVSVGSAELVASATSALEVNKLSLTSANTQSVAALQLEFSTTGDVEITNVQSNIEGMDVFSGTVDGLFKVGLLDMTGEATIPAGEHEVVTITYASTSSPLTGSGRTGDGGLELKNAIVVGVDASKMNVTITNKGVTVADGAATVLPKTFSLSQNVPNPFNPTTEIAYSIPKPTQVRIEVLNILGQNVRTLVDEYKVAGNYSVVWDGRDNSQQSVASGIYLYRITAGEFGETRKMVLMK